MRYADGDYFGELALRSSQPRAATVHAEAFTTLLRLDRAEFGRLVREQGDVGQLLEVQHAKYGAAEDAVPLSPPLPFCEQPALFGLRA